MITHCLLKALLAPLSGHQRHNGREGASPPVPPRLLCNGRLFPVGYRRCHLWYWLSRHAARFAANRQVHFAVRVVPVGRKRKVEANPDKGNRSKRKPAIKEVQHFGVDYAIDSSDLRFLAGKEGQRLELSIEVATFAGDGRLLNSLSGICSNDLKPSTLKDIVAGGVRIHQEIDVPIQAATLRLAVQDRTSSHLGTIELPLPVPAPPDIPRFKRSLPEVEPD